MRVNHKRASYLKKVRQSIINDLKVAVKERKNTKKQVETWYHITWIHVKISRKRSQ